MIELIKTLKAHNACDYTPIVLSWIDSGNMDDQYPKYHDMIKKHHNIERTDDEGITFFWCGPNHNWEPQYFTVPMSFINTLG